MRQTNTNFWFSIFSFLGSLSVLFVGVLFSLNLLSIALMAPEGTPTGQKIQLALNNLVFHQFAALLLAIFWLIVGVTITVKTAKNVFATETGKGTVKNSGQ